VIRKCLPERIQTGLHDSLLTESRRKKSGASSKSIGAIAMHCNFGKTVVNRTGATENRDHLPAIGFAGIPMFCSYM
jgi:hypothetical protein